MLPSRRKGLTEEKIKRLTLGGLDVYRIDSHGNEVFIPLGHLAKDDSTYFITFFEEDLIDDLLEDKRYREIVNNENLVIETEEVGGRYITTIYGFTYSTLVSALDLTYRLFIDLM